MPRGRKRQLKAAKNNSEYQQKTLVPQTCGFHIACFLQIKVEPLRNHRSTTNTSDPRISSCKPCCNQVGTLPEPLFQKCPGGEKGSSRQQKTIQNTSKRPWYLRPLDFILHAFFKSSWNPSGTTDPRQIPQTPGFHLVSLVAIKLEPFLNHCSRNAPGEKKAAQGSKTQFRIPAKDLGTSDLWISYCMLSSNQVGTPPEPRIHVKYLRPQDFIL